MEATGVLDLGNAYNADQLQVLLQKNGLHVVGITGLQLPVGLTAGVYYLQLHTDKGVVNERVVVK